MMYRSDDNLLDGIEAFIDLANTVTLFSAYLKLEALQKINAQKKIRQIIVRWDERDLCGDHPSSDLEAFAYCMEYDIELLRNKRLHIKALWNNESQILLGSANITKSGLGLRDGFNWELNGLISQIAIEDKAYLQNIIESAEIVDQLLHDRLKVMKDRTVVQEIHYEEITTGVLDPFAIEQLPDFKEIEDLYAAYSNPEKCAFRQQLEHDLKLYRIPKGLDSRAFHDRLISAFNNHAFVKAFVKHLSEEASRYEGQTHRSMRWSEVRFWILSKTTSLPAPNTEIQKEKTKVFYKWILFCNSKITTDQRNTSQLLHYDLPTSNRELSTSILKPESNSEYRFSLWSNLTEAKTALAEWGIDDLVAAIRSGQGPQGTFRNTIERLRDYPTPEEKKKIKTFELPAVTLSGVFSPRNRKGFIEHSGLMQIDIDDVKDLHKTMRKVQKDAYTFVSFISPSGTGIKCIVKVNPEESSHLEQFYALEKHYRDHLELTIDPKCKNVDRCMLLSFDEGIFFNPKADDFAETYLPPKPLKEYKPSSKLTPTDRLQSFEQSSMQLEELVLLIEAGQVDITKDYEDWYRIAYGLQSELGENGRAYFHRISQFFKGYSEVECDRQFDYVCRRNNHSIQIGTVFYIASQHGVQVETRASKSVAAEPEMTYELAKSQSTKSTNTAAGTQSSSSKIEFNKTEAQLYDALREMRLELSRQENIKAFQVFSNSTLREVVWKKPMNAEDLLKCRGIGPLKLLEYGKAILAITRIHDQSGYS